MVRFLLTALFALLLLSGCAQPRYVTASLYSPPRPVLPIISDAEWAHCQSDPVCKKMAKRALLTRQYAEDLEIIIQSTQGDQ